MQWRCGRFLLDLSEPAVMGILNVTPDSFSDGGLYFGTESAIAQARQMQAQGALIIDVGGESTRPGSDEVAEAEELRRVLPVVRQLADDGLIVSIDTRHASVAEVCIQAGAAIVNDVSGFRDPAMRALVAGSDVGCIVMHMLGEPKSMQADPHYDDVVREVGEYLLSQAGLLKAAGVARERIMIDPGPGFGKTFQHNLQLLLATAELAGLGYPLMAAFSRKRFVGDLTGIVRADERVTASVTVAVWAAAHGANVVRVHDVEPTVQALATWRALQSAEADWAAGSTSIDA